MLERKEPMANKFHPSLISAWIQYQDLYDRYMGLLRRVGEAEVLEELQGSLSAEIDYALSQWSDAKDRWETGGMDDLEWVDED